jgi:hypothetical protein
MGGPETHPPATSDGGTSSTPPPADLVFFAEGVNPAAASLFEGAIDDPDRAPQLVYPADGVYVPPNLNELEIQFLPGPDNELFRVTFELGAFRATVYTGCTRVGSGCAYTPDQEVWSTLANAARGRDPIAYRVRGTDASGARAGTSTARAMQLTEEDITGGLYYWNAPTGQILRYDFGRRGQRAERFLDPARVGAVECVGCHSLSRDGSRIAVALDEPNPSRVKVYDVESRAELFAFGGDGTGANFFSFSPDNSEVVVSDGIGLAIRDGRTGAVVQEIAGVFGSMPEWSPDGAHIVFTERPETSCELTGFDWEEWETGVPCVFPSVSSGQIGTLELEGGSWRRGPMLVARGSGNDFYPTYSPDGRWVLFNRSPTNRLSYDVTEEVPVRDHELWVVSASGGEPIHLAAAETGEGDAWPKWDPTEYTHRGEPIFWFTFASMRGAGLRSDGASQLWIAAFVPSRAAGGLDPAAPAIRLPFQGEGGGNHIAQWVTRVERRVCGESNECGTGEFCEDGQCVAEGPF